MSSTNCHLRRAFLLLALLFAVAWTSTASATTVLKFDLDSLVANSQRIVVAEVTEMRSLRKEGRIYTDTTLEIRETWKGESTHRVTVRLPGGRLGETVTRVHGLPGFQPGERVVVFLKEILEETDSKRFTVLGLRQGKFHVALGPDDSTEFAVPRLENLRILAPKNGEVSPRKLEVRGDAADQSSEESPNLRAAEPAAIHQKVLALEDLRARVERRLASQPEESSSGGAR